MKLGLLSDCHLESERLLETLPELLPEPGSVDAFLIAGDATKAQLVTRFCLMARDALGCPVVYTPGNHEYYYTSALECTVSELDERWRQEFAEHEGIHFLQNDSITIGDVDIFGSTWWSNFEAFGTDKMGEAKATSVEIADFDYIKTKLMKPKQIKAELERFNKKHGLSLSQVDYQIMTGKMRFLENITPDYMISLHLEALAAYKKWFKAASGKKVLMAHFPMITALQHGFYDKHPYFLSADDCFIDQNPPDLLIFGHTHYNHRLTTRGLRCVSNMLGYKSERAQAGYDRNLVIEI